MKYVALAVAIVAEVFATTALKQANGFTHPVWSIATVLGYAIAFYCLSLALKDIPTGVAYAVWSGVGIVLISVSARIFQGQKLDTSAIAGMALVIAGVVVMTTMSRAYVD